MGVGLNPSTCTISGFTIFSDATLASSSTSDCTLPKSARLSVNQRITRVIVKISKLESLTFPYLSFKTNVLGAQ